ncbi:hypothetical protein JYU34_011528 [Plutella xylostella]|uniref:unspecific monooxygenase n=1 Tax=Plutella xylostella TaxID=51655 RepID=A0ABQ7QHA1_PLUXY|nr:hypothetical protein JYU34_011528 [Plutella xylostella]
MFFTLSVILIALFIIYYWLKNKNSDYWKKRNVVYVEKKNPFGILWEFLTGNRSLAEVYKDIYDTYPGEPYVGVFIGSKPALLIRDPENIQAIFTSDFQSFHSRGIITNPNDVLADNILFMDDIRRWKLVRQKLSPIFTSSRLKNMFYIMEHCAKDFAIFIKENEELQKQPFNLLYTYTTASIGASVFGIDTKTKNSMNSPFHDMAWKSVTPSFKANLRFFVGNTFPSLFKMLKLKIFGDHEDFFVHVVKDVLQMRQTETNKRHDFIDICLDLQKNGIMKDTTTNYELELTDELIAAQAFFFFIAGADTSANTMHYTLLELSNNSNVLTQVVKEIDDVFDSCDNKLSYDHIEKMTYLDKVLNEALRKYPPIGLIQRKCTKDTVLPTGLKVSKNMITITPVFAIHRDVKYYPNPELYNPERFSHENAENLIKYTYLPFGEGNRICIGARYARLQVKAGLAWFLRCFTLEAQTLTPKTFEPSFFSLRATDCNYKLIPRSHSNLLFK